MALLSSCGHAAVTTLDCLPPRTSKQRTASGRHLVEGGLFDEPVDERVGLLDGADGQVDVAEAAARRRRRGAGKALDAQADVLRHHLEPTRLLLGHGHERQNIQPCFAKKLGKTR